MKKIPGRNLIGRAMLLAALSLSLLAQGPEESVDLHLSALVMRTETLTITQPTVTGSLLIDPAENVSLRFGSASETLRVQLTSPNGTSLTAGEPGTPGFRSLVFAPPRGGVGGRSYVFELANPTPGTWQYTIGETGTLAASRAVVFQMFSTSSVRAGVTGGQAEFIPSQPIRLALVAMDGNDVLKALTVAARIEKASVPGFAGPPVDFRDGGQGGDFTAGDGLYTAEFTLTDAGDYIVVAHIQGQSLTGAAFERTAAAPFSVFANRGRLRGTFADRGIDPDNNGLIDALVIAPGVNVTEAGSYRVAVTLRNQAGKELTASAVSDLPAGASDPEVEVAAGDLKTTLGFETPFDLTLVRLERETEDAALPVDEAYNLGRTRFYPAHEFERPAIEWIAGGSATAVDSDGNGKADLLRTQTYLDLLRSGVYQWSARLVDAKGAEIAWAAGKKYLYAGPATAELQFDGRSIGNAFLPGPWTVRNFSIYSALDSASFDSVLNVDAVPLDRFESGPAPLVLSFSATVGQPAPKPIALSVSGSGPPVFQSSSPWLSGALNNGTVEVRVDHQQLAPGTYQGTLRIDLGGASLPVTVNLKVSQPTELYALPSSLALSCTEGQCAAITQHLVISARNRESGFSIQSGAAWLAATAPGLAETPTSVLVAINGSGLAAGRYESALTFQPGSGTAATVPVVLVVRSAQPPSGFAVVNGATFETGPVAPGSLASAFGATGATAATQAEKFPLPLTLGGISVEINGVPAPLLYIDGAQINLQVPFQIAGTRADFVVKRGEQVIGGGSTALAAAAPGIFRAGKRAVALNQDGSINGPDHPAPPGSVVVLFFTGLGQVTPDVATGGPAPSDPLALPLAAVAATVQGQPAPIHFAGLAPNYAGLAQLNVGIGDPGPGERTITILLEATLSDSATIVVGGP